MWGGSGWRVGSSPVGHPYSRRHSILFVLDIREYIIITGGAYARRGSITMTIRSILPGTQTTQVGRTEHTRIFIRSSSGTIITGGRPSICRLQRG